MPSTTLQSDSGLQALAEAINWENPHIGREELTSRLDITRGIMWQYAIAYCGWDRCTNALGITQATQEEILAKLAHHLKSPKLTDSQRRRIAEWIPAEAMITEDHNNYSIDGVWVQSFLGIRDNYRDFPNWLLGIKPIKQAALLAILRNLVCHGSVLPTKARNWGLETVYDKGINVLGEGFTVLLATLMPTHTSRLGTSSSARVRGLPESIVERCTPQPIGIKGLLKQNIC